MGLFGSKPSAQPIQLEASSLTLEDALAGRYNGQIVTLTGGVSEHGAVMKSFGYSLLDCTVQVNITDISPMTRVFVDKHVKGTYSGRVNATGELQVVKEGKQPFYMLIVTEPQNISYTLS